MSELTLEREHLLAARSELQTAVSNLQRDLQLAMEKEQEHALNISELQAVVRSQDQASREQSAALASEVEKSIASCNDLQSALLAAKTILDQLQMTNESCRDYGSTLLEVSHTRSILPCAHLFFRLRLLQVLSGVEIEITSLHDLLQSTSSTVGASTAATIQLRQLHQVEVLRLQSEIEVQRSKVAQLTSDQAVAANQYENQIIQLRNEIDRVAHAEAAAKQALAHDRFRCFIPRICSFLSACSAVA